jgi:phosphatidylglycerophosphatase C
VTDLPGVAAFDFDGTLSRSDTMVPFLVGCAGWRRVGLAGLASWRHGLRGRDEMKVATVARLFRGWSEDRFADEGRTYAATLADVLRPESVERLRWHQSEGHPVVLVSAGLTTYLRPLAAELGIDDVLAVELEALDGYLTGAVLGGVNCRGPEKVARLEAWLGGDEPPLFAYGNSSGDRELLARADVGIMVRPRTPLPPLEDDHPG